MQDDLLAGWESPHAQPQAGVGGRDPLSPLSELPHPIIRKALESFGDDPECDNYVGRIKSSTRLVLFEIKSGQWRGGVWIDPETGVFWLIAAGLAKGGHKDHDDFYERVKRADQSGEIDRWLPTDDDRRQLKRETAARMLTDWELNLQRVVLEALRTVAEGGTTAFALPHPADPAKRFGECTLTVAQVHEPDFEYEETVVEIDLANEFCGSNLGWQATIRVLISISPPETSWDRFGDSYSTISELKSHFLRVDELQAITDRGQVAQSDPNDMAHYTHKNNLALSSVEGLGVRSMCGIYFVPYQDHESRPKCPVCEERYLKLPT
ncbi:DUF3039 domain-containing protein [Dactylosporangium siamense]|uniref:DUF3039 domain-containing protein n=1 Tax=Dactylosporangium siamense TaxID=685454 RepID=UPI0019446834|nr:DUF3039 domain-containing protein [Dactylosporangium siamense]